MPQASVFCFPYAGGNAYAYRPLQAHLPSAVDVSTVELPGRGRRMREPLLRSLDAMADDAFAQIRPRLTATPYALFGHSMGATLAYLCLQRIAAAGLPLARAAILSGRRGPSVEKRSTRHLLAHDDFRKMLTALGGCPVEVLADDDCFGFFEPILRADFQAVETWRPQRPPPLPVPLVVLRGRDDEVTRDEAAAWALETTASFELVEFDGGHFFLERAWPEIAGLIRASLAGD
jgi:surfactin synthase thioesterase subunit